MNGELRVITGYVVISDRMLKEALELEQRFKDIESGKVEWELPDDYDDYDRWDDE